jgi:hypothetical protein
MSSMATQIVDHIGHAAAPVAVAELYALIEGKRHSIRARVHEATTAGHIQRLGRGLYICPGTQMGAVADSRQALKELVAAGAKFSHIVLDLPYESRGTKGGNRHISRFSTITPLEFDALCMDVRQLLKDDTSTALFIFSTGKSSASSRKAYQAAIERNLKPAGFGEYTKTDRSGRPVQMLGRPIPNEGIWLYSRSGRLPFGMASIALDIAAVRPPVGGYPTEKSVALMASVIDRVTVAGDLVLDPFGGSGSTAETCALLGRSSLSLDIAHNPVAYREGRGVVL